MIIPAARLCNLRSARADQDKIMRMGDLIVAETRETGNCTENHLLQAGFSDHDIRDLGPQAKNYAACELTGGDAA